MSHPTPAVFMFADGVGAVIAGVSNGFSGTNRSTVTNGRTHTLHGSKRARERGNVGPDSIEGNARTIRIKGNGGAGSVFCSAGTAIGGISDETVVSTGGDGAGDSV